MPIAPDGPAPYAPTEAVIRTIEQHRNLGLPTPITSDVIARVIDSDALAPRVMKALRLYDLVDREGEPTPQFTELARATSDDEFRERFAEVLRAAYADVFQYVDPAQVDAERLAGQFRRYNPLGQRERMVMLFKGLCAYAGILPEGDQSPEPKPRRARPKATGKPTGTRTAGNGTKPKGGNRDDQEQTPPPPPSDAKARYLDLLLKKAEAEDTLNTELLDRIERVIGVARETDHAGTITPRRTSAPDDSAGGDR